MRQSWKSIVCAVCMIGAGTYAGYAQDVNTVGGTMQIPKGVTMVTASQTHSYAKAKELIQTKLQNQTVTGASQGQSKEQAMFLDIINQMGLSYDLYQLKGADKTGQKDAQVIAVDLKTAASAVQSQTGNNPAMAMVLQVLQQGTLDPATEQMMLTTVNAALPKEKTVIPLGPGAMAKNAGAADTSKGMPPVMINPDNTMNVTVEDTEPMKKLEHTKYPTYTAGARALFNSGGYLSPYYVKAALVMNPQKPTLYVAVTSDIQRGYFSSVLDSAFRSIK